MCASGCASGIPLSDHKSEVLLLPLKYADPTCATHHRTIELGLTQVLRLNADPMQAQDPAPLLESYLG